MASLLGLDWNNDGLCLVAGRGSGTKLVVEQAIFLPEPFRGDPGAAAAVGQQLKPLLKQAGIKATQTYATVGREHLICRDIRYPDVPAHEVAAIAQFQVSKELTIPAEQAVVDYVPVSVPWPSGEKRALGMVLRKDLLRSYERLCNEAGLTLAGLTPRAYALHANWAGLPRDDAANTVGLLAGGELTVVRQGEVLFSRQIDESVPLAPELRRSLAAYASQFPKQPMQELFLVDSGSQKGLEELQAAVRMPVYLYNPWSAVRSNLGPQQDVRFAAACGVVQLATAGKSLPLNFHAPKKGEPPPNKSRQYARIGVLVGILMIILVAGGYYWMTTNLEMEQEELQSQISKLTNQNKELGDVDKQLVALREWAEQEIVILDEIHDLVAVFPDTTGLRITRAQWSPITQPLTTAVRAVSTSPAASKEAKGIKPIGIMTLKIHAERPETLELLRRAIDEDNHWDVDDWRPDPQDRKTVTAMVKVYPKKPHEYTNTFWESLHKTNTAPPANTGPRRPPLRGGRP